jgi:proteasome lid subunit RPN8/RPN11
MFIRLHRGQMRWFRHKAKLAYPLETMAILVGQRTSPQVVGVSYFVYPKLEQAENYVKSAMSATQEYEFRDLLKDKNPGLRVVGTIHSHPGTLPMMSRVDKRTHKGWGDVVSGILTVLPSGKTALEFWQAEDCLALTVEYYK